jgi:hypothetical protein
LEENDAQNNAMSCCSATTFQLETKIGWLDETLLRARTIFRDEGIAGNALYFFTSSQSPIALPSVSLTNAKNAMSNIGPLGVIS